MTGVFNKQDFNTKLHFTMCLILATSNGLCDSNNKEDVKEIIDFFWCKALQNLWQTRNEGAVLMGIDKPSDFEAYRAIMEIGINQLNHNINNIVASKHLPAVTKMSQLQAEMKEMAASLTDDIANLLNHKQNEAA